MSLEKNRYKDVLDVYTDLSLVFWNAMYFNEEDSQIWQDASSLKVRSEFDLRYTVSNL
jgi:chromatin structure-remodeling complex subunit RSC1/2